MNKNPSGKIGAAKRSFTQYASYYDILYQDKDYAAEALFIAKLLDKILPRKRENIKILDLACGTGRHAIELKQLGYQIEGSDSSKEMVGIAARESKKRNLDIPLYNETFQTIAGLGNKYDAVISMFSAINYLVSYNDLSVSLNNISSLLSDKGIFIFDFWNGNAVVEGFSPVRVKRMAKGGVEVLRISETAIDRISQTASVKFNFMITKGRRIITEFEETHLIRYFFLQEMNDLLQANNLKVIFRCPFMKASSDILASEWNITYVVCKADSKFKHYF